MGAAQRLAIGVSACFLLALAMWVGPGLSAFIVAVMGISVAVGWPFLIDLPNPGTARRVIAGTAVLAAVAGYFGTSDHVVLVAGAVVVAAFIAEMARRDGRPRLLEQISGVVTGGLVVTMGALWIHAGRLEGQPHHIVSLTLASYAIANVWQWVIPAHHRHLRPLVALAVGAGIGTVMSLWLDVPAWGGMLIGLASAIPLALIDPILLRLPPATRRRPGVAIAMVPILGLGLSAFLGVLLFA